MSNIDDAEYRLCPKCSTAYTGVHHCQKDADAKASEGHDTKEDTSRLVKTIRQARKLSGHFNVLGLQLATGGFLSVSYGTSASISLGIVPIDLSKESPMVLETKQPELNAVGNLILRMARSAQVFSTDMAVAGFSLRRITVSVAGLGIAIPSATASLTLAAGIKKKDAVEQHRSLISKVVHSPLTLLENLSEQALAMAHNFRAVGFELTGLGASPWLTLTVGTYFGISISVCPIKKLTPLTQGDKAATEPVDALPLEHLTAFQSVILNLLLRANQTVSLMLGGTAEVGMVTLSLNKVGLAIPALTATVSCVSVTREKPNVVVKEEVLSATKAELTAVNEQLKAQPPANTAAATPVTENVETFLHEVETIAGIAPPNSTTTTASTTTATTTSSTTSATTATTTAHASSTTTSSTTATTATTTTNTTATTTATATRRSSTAGATATTTTASTTTKEDNLLTKSGKHVKQGVNSLVHGAGVTLSQTADAVNTVVDMVAHGVEKGVKAVIIRPVKGVVEGIGAAWNDLYKDIREADDLGILDATESVAKEVKQHGFRLCNPRWLDLTIGTVLGCAIYLEPMPDVEVTKVKHTKMPTDLASAMMYLFKRAADIVDDAADALEDNSVSLNSINLRAGGLGLGIPVLSFGIVLDRNLVFN